MPKRKILKDFLLDEISPVDRPAQSTALATILKRDDGRTGMAATIAKEFCKRHTGALTFADALTTNRVNDALWPMTDALSTSIRNIVDNGEMDAAARANAIATNIDAFAAKMRELTTEGEDPLIKFATDLIAGTIGDTPDEDITMPSTSTKDLEKKVTDLTTQLADALAVSKLNDAEKTFAEAMDDKAKKAFTALSADERKAQMDLTKRDDETLVVDGNTVSKNAVGDSVFAVLKSQQAQIDAQKTAVEKAQRDAETAVLTKRASDEFGHLPCKAEELAPVLKAVEGMPEAVRTTAEAILKAAEGMAAKAFDTTGHRGSLTPEGATAIEKLDSLAKNHAEEHNLGYEISYAAVIEKHVDLYEQAINQ